MTMIEVDYKAYMANPDLMLNAQFYKTASFNLENINGASVLEMVRYKKLLIKKNESKYYLPLFRAALFINKLTLAFFLTILLTDTFFRYIRTPSFEVLTQKGVKTIPSAIRYTLISWYILEKMCKAKERIAEVKALKSWIKSHLNKLDLFNSWDNRGPEVSIQLQFLKIRCIKQLELKNTAEENEKILKCLFLTSEALMHLNSQSKACE
ncbi:MAG: hypothetical protein H0W88_05050 [Parachlamydiaceae bacterium]|nr:hypothetical protein [Parachlamydiaceae bacterium]